jgi:hypothetical protein
MDQYYTTSPRAEDRPEILATQWMSVKQLENAGEPLIEVSSVRRDLQLAQAYHVVRVRSLERRWDKLTPR